jgi:tRNA A37 threonylcarbamoyladenosine synthetase subunit TsaC/SUA5/YrdC
MSILEKKTTKWNGSLSEEGYSLLANNNGSMIVSPTKVGYIVMTSDRKGLERKFTSKNRNLNKPGVVLCGSMEELKELAQLTPEITAFYQMHWDQDVLLGCILPWKEDALKHIPNDGSRELMMDKRQTSCFVIKFGTPSEQLAKQLWEKDKKLVFASSANPSGQGNRGLLEGIGERIENEADLLIEANDYVASIQPEKSQKTRYEQGVMVSMVDEAGTIVPAQGKERGVLPCPILIRKGLDVDKIMMNLSDTFLSWDYRQGFYY